MQPISLYHTVDHLFKYDDISTFSNILLQYEQLNTSITFRYNIETDNP